MNVKFWTFLKKVDSTALPPATPNKTVYCVLKEPCDILHPSLRVTMKDVETSPSIFNYVYISDFGRYYFVNRWVCETAYHWVCDLTVDTLASNQALIKSTSAYILRSASSYNGDIIDTAYPTKAGSRHNVTAVNNPWARSFAGGSYVVGIINDDTNSFGAVSYYAMNQSQFVAFCSALFSNTNWLDVGSVIDSNLLRTLFNPFQYVVSCKWFPFQVPISGTATSLPFGWWSLNNVSASKVAPGASFQSSVDFPVMSHPQASSRGSFLNTEPYTRRTINAQPFGDIYVDTSKVKSQDTINLGYVADCITGQITYELYSSDGIIGSGSSAIGVDIQIAQLSNQWENASITQIVTSAATTGSGSYGKGFGLLQNAEYAGYDMQNGQSPRSFSTPGDYIGNGVAYTPTQLLTSGSNGSIASLGWAWKIISDFALLVDEDRAEIGRPLCKKDILGNYSGYLLCANAHIEIPGTREESEIIDGYLNGGFFLED